VKPPMPLLDLEENAARMRSGVMNLAEEEQQQQ
jgi:hypothetical protein